MSVLGLIGTIESTWRHLKAFLNPYNGQGDYIFHLPQYMFAARCRSRNVNQSTSFHHIVADPDWSVTPLARDAALT